MIENGAVPFIGGVGVLVVVVVAECCCGLFVDGRVVDVLLWMVVATREEVLALLWG